MLNPRSLYSKTCSCVVLATIVSLVSFGLLGVACEDKHPPIVSMPKHELLVRASTGATALTLEVDPRGISRVVPSGEGEGRWIDPSDPTGAWHYREWQWWKEHPWGDSCRPRYYAEVELRTDPGKRNQAVIAYRIDGFDCRQVLQVPDSADPDAPYWDIVTSVRNATGHDVEEYGQFFACYTPLNRKRSFWYWDESDKLVLFSDRGVTHLDGYVANPDAYFVKQGAIPHCPRGGGKIVGRWRRPVMVSQASPAGWRSIIMLEPQRAAALAHGITGGAMDYIIFPGVDQPTFANGAQFSVCIRHIMLKSPELPSIVRLQRLWDEFERTILSSRDRT